MWNAEVQICGKSAVSIQPQNSLYGGLCMVLDIGIACIAIIYLDAPILFFPPARKSSLCMDASGINTLDAAIRMFLNHVLNTGGQS